MAINRYCQAIGCGEKVAFEFELVEHIRPYVREKKAGSYCRQHMVDQMKYLLDEVIGK